MTGAVPAGQRALTLLTRLDCPLCDEFLGAARVWAAARGDVELEVVNVDADAALAARHGLKVPLLLAADQELCAFRFRASRVDELLAHA